MLMSVIFGLIYLCDERFVEVKEVLLKQIKTKQNVRFLDPSNSFNFLLFPLKTWPFHWAINEAQIPRDAITERCGSERRAEHALTF